MVERVSSKSRRISAVIVASSFLSEAKSEKMASKPEVIFDSRVLLCPLLCGGRTREGRGLFAADAKSPRP